MTDISQPTRARRAHTYAADEPTAWVGWIVFSGIMLIMLGSFQAIMGLVALFDDGYYLVTGDGLIVQADFTTWGWVHLTVGVIAVLTGVGIMLGQMWARVAGIVLAVLSALINLAFLAAYPIWSVLIIVFDVIVIYALAVHGGEMKHAD